MNARQAKILDLIREAKDMIEQGMIMEPQHQVKTVETEGDAASISAIDSHDMYLQALDNLTTSISMIEAEFPAAPPLTTKEKFELYFRQDGVAALVYESETSLFVNIPGKAAPSLTFNDKEYAKQYIDQRVTDTGLINPQFLNRVSGPF